VARFEPGEIKRGVGWHTLCDTRSFASIRRRQGQGLADLENRCKLSDGAELFSLFGESSEGTPL
jgi:hypothetical protein